VPIALYEIDRNPLFKGAAAAVEDRSYGLLLNDAAHTETLMLWKAAGISEYQDRSGWLQSFYV
jgi:hypothetical protein